MYVILLIIVHILSMFIHAISNFQFDPAPRKSVTIR